ncbi:hypothetical protein HK097_006236, partial [Rhizophlyctis rosea]
GRMKGKGEAREAGGGGREEEKRDRTEEVVFRRRLVLLRAMREEGIVGFTKVFTSPSIRVGQSIILQTVGLGELAPNTVIMSWPSRECLTSEFKDHAVEEIWRLQESWFMTRRAGYSSIICKGLEQFPSNEEAKSGFIDVWWIVQEGQLQLLIAYILQQHHVWRGCQIRLFTIACATDDPVAIEHELKHYLSAMRIHVAVLEIVTVTVLDPEALGPVPTDPGPVEEVNWLTSVRESMLVQALKKDFENEALGLGSGDREGDEGVVDERYDSSTFVRTWLHTTSALPLVHRRELFLKAHTVATLKREIDKRSGGEETELVLMNLPVMDLCGG